MLSSKCEVCNSKNSKFIKDQEASPFFSSLETKTPLSKTCFRGISKLIQDMK